MWLIFVATILNDILFLCGNKNIMENIALKQNEEQYG
jgi:hypothetical protein